MSSVGRISKQGAASLLSIPLELRIQILSYLVRCEKSITVRCLFIRHRYQSIFMTQQEKNVYTHVLRVCRQLTRESLPLLYAQPMWRCACRMDGLASQIGAHNFSLIRRMTIDFDDLAPLANSLHQELRFALDSSTPPPRLHFAQLEELETAGVQISVRCETGSTKARVEAIQLCETAQKILRLHPKFVILVEDSTRGNGGSDAQDITYGRTRWRFLANTDQVRETEYVVDVEGMSDIQRRYLDA